MQQSLDPWEADFLRLEPTTTYNRATTAFEQADILLSNFGLLERAHGRNSCDEEKKKRGTPFGQLVVNADLIPEWLAEQNDDSYPVFEAVLDVYVRLMGDYGYLNTSGEPFELGDAPQDVMTLFVRCGYAEEIDGKYRWTDRIALSMWRNGFWSLDNPYEMSLASPLIEKLTESIPDYVETRLRTSVRKAVEIVIVEHYRFEEWMPRDSANELPSPNYWDGFVRKLVDNIIRTYTIWK